MTEKLGSFKELHVWQRSYSLCIRLYRLTQKYPSHELYGLTSQIRRASVSVPSNIAEGYNRGARRDYVRFLRIARGSLAELETQLMLSESLEFASKVEIEPLVGEVSELERMLRAMIRSLVAKGET